MKKILSTFVGLAMVGSALAFPAKVKVLKTPDLANSEGTQVVVKTDKGTIAVSSKFPAYQALSRVKVGQCLTLETDSESDIEFNKKLDHSGVSSVYSVKC